MAPPQVIISPPQPDNSNNSILSSFMTKILNESNLSNSRTNMSAVEPPRVQQSYFNARESILPRMPGTPNQRDIIQEIKPSMGKGPPPLSPPPPPPPPPPSPPPPPVFFFDNQKKML